MALKSFYKKRTDPDIGSVLEQLGWMKGLEPSTTASTVRRSAIELHPPRKRYSIMKPKRLQAVFECFPPMQFEQPWTALLF